MHKSEWADLMDCDCYHLISPLGAEIEILRPAEAVVVDDEVCRDFGVDASKRGQKFAQDKPYHGGGCDGVSELSAGTGGETRRLNLIRGRGLIRRYLREEGIAAEEADLNPKLFVNWLLGLRRSVTSGTWRNYRAQAQMMIESWPSDEHIQEALAMLAVGRGARVRHERRTITRADFDRVRASLSCRRGATARSLEDLSVAAVCTGLSTRDWSMASIVHCDHDKAGRSKTWLLVRHSPEEGLQVDGARRALDLSEFPTEVLAAVERTVIACRGWTAAGVFSRRTGELSRLFRVICEALFPKLQVRLSLEALRNQFIANAKSRYSIPEVAALLGMFPDRVEMSVYRKRRVSWSEKELLALPEPRDDEVARFANPFEKDRLRELTRAARRSGML